MRCSSCRAEILEGLDYCQECGHPIGKIVPKKTESCVVKCPKCGSTAISANKKGFGLGKAAVGAVVTGGVGLLGGFIGSGKVEITCLMCGKKWMAGKK